jgi:hypothetical protein
MVIAVAPSNEPAGRSGRKSYREPRARKLSPDDEAEICQATGTRSLRNLAAAYGFSYETIRATVNRSKVAMSVKTFSNERGSVHSCAT